MLRISWQTCALSTSASSPSVEELIKALTEAMHDADRRADRIIFARHPAFKPGVATVVRAGGLTMVCATPNWWDEFADRCHAEHVKVSDRAGMPLRFRGIPVYRLEYYRKDPDWPVILEAIMRLKLIDFSAVFS